METAINFLDDLETLAETAEDDMETLETSGDLETLETLGDLNSRVEALGTEESNLGINATLVFLFSPSNFQIHYTVRFIWEAA